MLIETWVAVMIILSVFLLSLIGLCGWILEGIRLEKSERQNKKLIAENGRLYKIIEHMNGVQTVNAANEFYQKGERDVSL